MADGGKLIAKVPLSGRKSFAMGVVIPHRLGNFTNCQRDLLYDGCDKFVNQRKEVSAILNQLKRQCLNEFGEMLPKYTTT